MKNLKRKGKLLFLLSFLLLHMFITCSWKNDKIQNSQVLIILDLLKKL